jgi:hypothetical protein
VTVLKIRIFDVFSNDFNLELEFVNFEVSEILFPQFATEPDKHMTIQTAKLQ